MDARVFRRIGVTAALVAAFFAACSGDDGTGTDGGTGGGGQGGGSVVPDSGSGDGGLVIDANNFCARFADTFCTKSAQCGRYALEHAFNCFNDQLLSCERGFGQPLRAGALALTSSATACLLKLSAASCDELDLTVASDECSQPAVTPAQVLGGTCTAGTRCLQGHCSTDAGSTCGSCSPFLPLGASCTVNAGQCDPDAGICSNNGNQSVCRPWLNDGQSCLGTGAAVRCRSGLCPSRPDGGALCGPFAVGETCTSHAVCGPSRYCRGLVRRTLPITDGVCANRIALGGTCTDEETDDGCSGALATCLDARCVIANVGSRTQGQSCDELDQCAPGLFCQGQRTSARRLGTCAPKLPLDAGCAATTPSECRDEYICVGAVCRERRDFGESCLQNAQCRSYAACLLGADGGRSCVPYAAEGQACPTTGACLNGFCAPSPDAGFGICTSYRQTGGACTGGTQCVSASCVNQTCSGGCFPTP